MRKSTRLVECKPSAADLARAASAVRYSVSWMLTDYFALRLHAFGTEIDDEQRKIAKEHTEAMLLAASIAEERQRQAEPTFWEAEHQ